eukprot:TRINITY_DN3780_c0_g1_i1.p1 TRINITY_DN3780_c0_g1~~TRINITY_DN3780_c0_g1_i1.p1  ORF type:complete len:962 (-),score=332.18 TRINITY_DN3780_c0_g1_i1:63-2948(-)
MSEEELCPICSKSFPITKLPAHADACAASLSYSPPSNTKKNTATTTKQPSRPRTDKSNTSIQVISNSSGEIDSSSSSTLSKSKNDIEDEDLALAMRLQQEEEEQLKNHSSSTKNSNPITSSTSPPSSPNLINPTNSSNPTTSSTSTPNSPNLPAPISTSISTSTPSSTTSSISSSNTTSSPPTTTNTNTNTNTTTTSSNPTTTSTPNQFLSFLRSNKAREKQLRTNNTIVNGIGPDNVPVDVEYKRLQKAIVEATLPCASLPEAIHLAAIQLKVKSGQIIKEGGVAGKEEEKKWRKKKGAKLTSLYASCWIELVKSGKSREKKREKRQKEREKEIEREIREMEREREKEEEKDRKRFKDVKIKDKSDNKDKDKDNNTKDKDASTNKKDKKSNKKEDKDTINTKDKKSDKKDGKKTTVWTLERLEDETWVVYDKLDDSSNSNISTSTSPSDEPNQIPTQPQTTTTITTTNEDNNDKGKEEDDLEVKWMKEFVKYCYGLPYYGAEYFSVKRCEQREEYAYEYGDYGHHHHHSSSSSHDRSSDGSGGLEAAAKKRLKGTLDTVKQSIKESFVYDPAGDSPQMYKVPTGNTYYAPVSPTVLFALTPPPALHLLLLKNKPRQLITAHPFTWLYSYSLQKRNYLVLNFGRPTPQIVLHSENTRDIQTIYNTIHSYCLSVKEEGKAEEAEKGGDRARMKHRILREGMKERQIGGDGNCQFRALSDQLFGEQSKHAVVRRSVVQWLKENENWGVREGGKVIATLGEFRVEGDGGAWDGYCDDMSKSGKWGDHLTLVAAAHVYAVKIWILSSVFIQNYDANNNNTTATTTDADKENGNEKEEGKKKNDSKKKGEEKGRKKGKVKGESSSSSSSGSSSSKDKDKEDILNCSVEELSSRGWTIIEPTSSDGSQLVLRQQEPLLICHWHERHYGSLQKLSDSSTTSPKKKKDPDNDPAANHLNPLFRDYSQFY